MNREKRDLIFKYLQEQIAQADFRAKAYVFDDQNRENPTRNCFVKLSKHLHRFLEGDTAIRWLIISGFRGVGKTTLLSQLYYKLTDSKITKLYLSVDQLTQIIGVSLIEVLTVYEELLGVVFERLEKPVVIFLDEVQYDKKWGLALKTIFDRSNKVFIIATGSSAVTLQTNPDIVRRAIFEKLFPMSFTEYLKIKDNKFEVKGLGNQIRKAIFESGNAEEVYKNLKNEEISVQQYWVGVERLEIDRYMKYGSLPFAIRLKNEGLVYDQIKKILDRVISMDIVDLEQFTKEILGRIPEILYSIAASDVLSVTNLAKDLNIDRLTLTTILSVLEKTETLLRIYPYGAHASQVRKPSKYLFSSPAFRAMYYNFVGNIIGQEFYLGKLLEDTVGLYLTRFFAYKNASLTYDSSLGSADFVIRFQEQNIILEVSYGKKGFKQILRTREKIKAKYGLLVSDNPLSITEDKAMVNIPLHFFLLI